MSNPTPITLASGKVGGESIIIELTETPNTPGSVKITWPKQPMSVSARRFPDIAAVVARLFANGSTELARAQGRSSAVIGRHASSLSHGASALRHPLLLMLPAVFADTASHVGGIGAVLEVISAGCRSGRPRALPTLFVILHLGR